MPLSLILELISVSVLCVVFGGFAAIFLGKLAGALLELCFEAPVWICGTVSGLVGVSAALLGAKATLALIKWLVFT